MRLDLHGVRHADVEYTVKRWIEDVREESGSHTIITGHSHIMQGYVLLELERYDLEWEVVLAEIKVRFA